MATDNLNIHRQINTLLRQRTQTLAVHGDMLRDQVALAGSLNTALEGADPEEVADRYTDVLAALDEVSRGARRTGRSMEEATREGSSGAQRLVDAFKTVASVMWKLVKLPFKMGFSIVKFIGKLAVKSTMLLWNTLKGLVGVMKQIVTGAFNIGKSLVVYVSDVMQNIIDLSDAMAKKWLEIRRTMESAIRIPFGDFTEDISRSIKQSTSNMSNLSEVQQKYGLSMYSVFQDVGEATQWLSKYFENMGAIGSLLGAEIADMGMDFVLAAKGMGINEEQMKSLGERAISMGKPFKEILGDMANMSLQLSEDFDFSGKIVGKTMAQMTTDVKHFGNLSFKQLGKVAIRARSLGLEVKSLEAVIDKHLSFDDAAESAAMMSQAFGANFDAIKLMNEASQGGMGVIEEYRRGLFAAGRSAEKMSVVQLRLLAQNTGLSEGEARLAFSMKNRGKSMEEISKSAEFAAKKELTQAEATQKLADATERYIRFIEMQGGMFERFFQGFGRGILMNEKFISTMLQVRKASELIEMAGRRVGDSFFNNFSLVDKFSKATKQTYDPERYKALGEGLTKGFDAFFVELSDPSKAQDAVKNLFLSLKATFTKYFSFRKIIKVDGVKKDVTVTFADILKEGLTMAGDAISGAIPFLGKQITLILEKLKDIVQGKLSFSDLFSSTDAEKKEGEKTFGEILIEMKNKIMDQLTTLWNEGEIQTALIGLFDAITKAMDKMAKKFGDDSGNPSSPATQSILEALKKMLLSGIRLLGQVTGPIWSYLWNDVIKKGFRWVLDKKLKPWASEKLEELKGWAYEKFLDAVKGIGYAIGTGLKFALGFVMPGWTAISTVFTTTIDVIKRLFAGESIADIMADYFDKIKKKIDDFMSGGVLTTLIDSFTAVGKGIKAAFGGEVEQTVEETDKALGQIQRDQVVQPKDIAVDQEMQAQSPGKDVAPLVITANVNRVTPTGVGLDEEALVNLGPLYLNLRLQVNLDANRVANVLINQTRIIGTAE